MFEDDGTRTVPDCWRMIEERSKALGFEMPSDTRTGALLQALSASKPHGRILEMGTGTGLSTACILAGMNPTSRLVSVDVDDRYQQVARSVLGSDPRVAFVLCDGIEFLKSQTVASFDLVFADAWPGKYEGLDVALALIRPGGFYVVDDMIERTSWSDDHRQRARHLIAFLSQLDGWTTVIQSWGSGFAICVRR